MNRRSVIIRLVASNLMIIIGAIIYITSRYDIIFVRWIPITIINTFREISIDNNSLLEYVIIYCLPDGLWYGALLLVQMTLMGKSVISRCIYWISIVLPFMWEILQIHDAISGTFDPMDILMYFIVLLLFITIQKHTTWLKKT